MRLLKRLFNINFNTIRIKPGEPIPVDSTCVMSYIYGDANEHLFGFKVDSRFIYDFDLKGSREDANDHNHSESLCERKTKVIRLFNITIDLPLEYTCVHSTGTMDTRTFKHLR
ncbi:MAG: hypothetical protein EXX96DRAFT_534740 [Benjaminiella poitrasii]|nr:MAG: hypothetical protein EXX96DRAFT_534740 [Benjaminiella poitrasii]